MSPGQIWARPRAWTDKAAPRSLLAKGPWVLPKVCQWRADLEPLRAGCLQWNLSQARVKGQAQNLLGSPSLSLFQQLDAHLRAVYISSAYVTKSLEKAKKSTEDVETRKESRSCSSSRPFFNRRGNEGPEQSSYYSFGLHPDFLAHLAGTVPCLACHVELSTQTGKCLLGSSSGRLLTLGLGLGPKLGPEVQRYEIHCHG